MNACIRFIFNLCKDEHVSRFYNTLGWLPPDDRRVYSSPAVWSLLYLTQASLPTLPPTSVLAHARGTPRVPLLMILRFPLQNHHQQSFHYVTPSLWNSVPLVIRQAKSLNSFKHALFCHLRRRVPCTCQPILPRWFMFIGCVQQRK